MEHSLPGTILQVRGERWRLTRVDAFERCAVLTLDGREAANAHRRLRVIEPFDRPVRMPADRLVRRRRRTVVRAALAAAAGVRPPLGLWTAARASIDLHAYQLEPALAVLRGATRVLLADAVGLGKTIQAGLILAELRERGWADRALVLCPPGLRDTWAAELQRFGLAAAVIDQAAMAERAAVLPPGVNPWTGQALVVASIDFVKRPEVMASLRGVSFDVLVADEAHHLTPGTDRGAAVAHLAAAAPWCVFVSATPHSGDAAAFTYLTRLGEHGDPIAIFRRTRRDAGRVSARRTRPRPVRANADEARLLAAVEEYARAIWRARGAADRAVQLVAITLARRAASSMRAVERTLARRLLLLGTPPGPAQPSLPWEEEETADAGGDGGILCCRGLVDEQEERAAIAHLLALARAAGPGAKIRWLTRALGRLREPAIVFTEYRDTVEALLDALPGTVRVASISGASPVDARAQAVAAFNGGLVDLLVATDAAGEGLNLHHRCRLVIDLELPWNPVRLEQRLGRVDRLGQRRRVHAIRLHHPDGIEARVLDRLRLRQRRAGLGDEPEPRSELEVARAIFDGAASEPEPPPAIQSASVPAARGEAARLSQQRRAAALPGADTTSAVWTQPQRTAATRLAVLHAVTVTNGFGAMVSELVHAHEVHACAPPARAGWRAIVESVRHSVRMRASLRTRSDRVRLDAERELGPIRTAVTARLAAIRERLARERAQALQRSLFDRRAEAGAAHADDVAGRHDMALALRQASVTSPVPRDGVAARLLAIWPLEPR